jgi:AAA15 family ATPase/GTPase
MYLSRIFIRNYRSIEILDLELRPGKNVIVGRNNSGKSNILSAIDLVLGEATPDYKKSENVTETDFHSRRVIRDRVTEVETADDMFIWCQLTRSAGEILDYESLYDCFGFYVVNDWGRSGPRRRFPLQNLLEDYPSIFEITDEIDSKTYLNPKLRNQRTFEQEFDDKLQFAFAFRAQRRDGLIEKEIRLLYRESEASSWILALRASIRTALIQSAVMPSFRDPQAQLRVTPWSWYGKLLRHLTAGSATVPAVEEALKTLRQAADTVFESARTRIEQSTLSVAFPGTTISFQFSTDRAADIHRNCVIYVDDGFRSLLTEKGSGIQSATVIGLFCYYTKEVNIQASALLCVEEPELYLHPHARRVLSDRMDEFLDGNRNQVVMTTHSVEFIRSIQGDVNVILVRRSSTGSTTAKNVSLKTFARLLRDNNQNEIFFADKVIVCEGHDDVIITIAARELFPGQLDQNNVSIVSVSGKDNICQLVKLVMKLEIRCFVLADFDFLLRDKAVEREQYGAKAHDTLGNLPEAFFSQLPLVENGPELLSCIHRVRSYLKANKQREFYTAKAVSELCIEPLQPALKQLRLAGIGVLDAELESLSLDTTLITGSSKVDLACLQEIARRLAEGQRFSTLFDLMQIREFLSAVFEIQAPHPEPVRAMRNVCQQFQAIVG